MQLQQQRHAMRPGAPVSWQLAAAARMAFVIPVRTSGVVVALADASTLALPAITTQSVLVPPTSIPSLHPKSSVAAVIMLSAVDCIAGSRGATLIKPDLRVHYDIAPHASACIHR